VTNLAQSLQDADRGFLAIVAELWGLDDPTARSARALAEAMLQPGVVEEMVEGLSERARGALHALQLQGGRMPLAEMNRRFGPLREIGTGRRDRERPWRRPASALEELWYRGLVGRAFSNTAKGLEEFAFLPADLLARLPPGEAPSAQLDEVSPRRIRPAGTQAVDDATTLLAACRLLSPKQRRSSAEQQARLAGHLLQPDSLRLLLAILGELALLNPSTLEPDPRRTQRFLQATRGAALGQLLRAWAGASTWNDLAQLDGLRPPRGKWPNDPLATRQAALGPILRLATGHWWPLAGLLEALRSQQPGFLRPGGDFDAWYLQDAGGQFLPGLQAWDQVEGALLIYLLSGPLHWLGAVDLGGEGGALAFRLTPAARALVDPGATVEAAEPGRRARPRPNGPAPAQRAAGAEPAARWPHTAAGPPRHARLSADGRLSVARAADRTLRYQVARFCRWTQLDRRREEFVYQLTPTSLERGRQAGLLPRHMLAVLGKITGGRVPRSIEAAVRRWGERGSEAALNRVLVLKVSEAGVLDELLAHPDTARLLGERLGPTQVGVRERDWQALCAAALRRGMLIDWPPDAAGEWG
jgi:transposase